MRRAAVTSFVTAEARQVVEALATSLERNFVFPEVGKNYAVALRTKLAAGGYDRFASGRDFAAAVTADLQAVAKDGHLKLMAPAHDSAAPRRAASKRLVRKCDRQERVAGAGRGVHQLRRFSRR